MPKRNPSLSQSDMLGCVQYIGANRSPMDQSRLQDLLLELQSAIGHRESPPLLQVVEEYEEKVFPKLAKNTRLNKTYSHRFLVALFGDVPVADIKPEHAELAMKLKGKPLAGRQVVNDLKALCTYAGRRGWGPRQHALRLVDLPKSGRREDVYTAAQLSRAISKAYVVAPRECADLFHTLATTGLRLMEASSLEWRYIDTSRGRLRLLDSKTGPRTVPLSKAARAHIDRIPRVSRWPHKVIPQTARKWWRVTCEEAGVPKYVLHTLRHTFATLAILNGERIEKVAKAMGHSHAYMTERYCHLQPEDLTSVGDAVADAIEREGKR